MMSGTVKLISADGDAVACESDNLAKSSKELAAMLSFPVLPHRKKNERDFLISSEALKIFVEYIETGRTPRFRGTAVKIIIELADRAEQNALANLKSSCVCKLSMMVEKPEDCFDIIRFADTDEIKQLKINAMAVLINNYEKRYLELAFLRDYSVQGDKLWEEIGTLYEGIKRANEMPVRTAWSKSERARSWWQRILMRTNVAEQTRKEKEACKCKEESIILMEEDNGDVDWTGIDKFT